MQIENKVKKTIIKYKLFNKKQKILVAVSGGKDSTTLLYILKKLNYNIQAITIDAKIGNYTKKNLQNIRSFCKKLNIKLHEVEFAKEFGHSLCHLQSILKSNGYKYKYCTTCGVLRRYLLNKYARKLKPDKIATGHNLDDEAETILINLLKNKLDTLTKLGPAPGLVKDKKFIPRVKPLYFVTEKQIIQYSKLKKFPVNYEICPHASESYRRNIINLLKTMPEKTKLSLIKNFLKILPKLKKQYKTKKKINYCQNCQEPSKKNLCRTCQILSFLKIK